VKQRDGSFASQALEDKGQFFCPSPLLPVLVKTKTHACLFGTLNFMKKCLTQAFSKA